jgi:hypothetical protein
MLFRRSWASPRSVFCSAGSGPGFLSRPRPPGEPGIRKRPFFLFLSCCSTSAGSPRHHAGPAGTPAIRRQANRKRMSDQWAAARCCTLAKALPARLRRSLGPRASCFRPVVYRSGLESTQRRGVSAGVTVTGLRARFKNAGCLKEPLRPHAVSMRLCDRPLEPGGMMPCGRVGDVEGMWACRLV